jgi:hypothetical protein
MNKIDTSQISDPNVQQGFTGKSLAFLQNATNEAILALAQALIGETYDSTKAYILKGVDAYGTNQYNEGYILWSGEVYYTLGKSSITAFSNVAVMTIAVTNDGTADPAPFSDGSTKYVHNIRRFVLSDALTGTGTFDLSAAIYIIKNNTWNEVGASGQPAYSNSYAGAISSRAGANLKFSKSVLKNAVTFMGGIQRGIGISNTIVFTLPVGYRPTVERSMPFTTEDTSGIFVGYMHVDTNGDVKLYLGGGDNTTNTIHFCEGISFSLD